MINVRMQTQDTRLKPKITVIGVGGGGCNAVNNMIVSNQEGCEFLVCNTDAQSLDGSIAEQKIQLGVNVTRGLGAGANPEVGAAAATETIEEILTHLDGSNMVFVTAGMGGGTGTGAAPVIAREARERGILTVGVVTRPFHFEGTHRMKLAEAGIEEMQKYVDTLIVIPNQNLFRIANEKTTFADAFKMADEVLQSGVRGVTDLMVMPGMINLDFADVRAVMAEMGKAVMGTGEAEGERRAIEAAEAAISNPLLDDVSMRGAKGVLINITGGDDIGLFEVDEAANRIREEIDPEANIIFGSAYDPSMTGKIRVSVVATGIDLDEKQHTNPMSLGVVNSEKKPVTHNDFASNTSGVRNSVDTAGYQHNIYMPSQSAPVQATSNAATIASNAMKTGDQVAETTTTQPEMGFTSAPAAQQGNAAVARKLDEDEFDTSMTSTKPRQSAPNSSSARNIPPMSRNLDDIMPRPAPSHARVEQPVAKVQGENFIPPQPMQAPRQNNVDVPAMPSSSPVAPVATRTEAPVQKKSKTLFERFIGGRDEEELKIPTSNVEVQRTTSIEPGHSEKSEEDELDIPAFLRRQAN